MNCIRRATTSDLLAILPLFRSYQEHYSGLTTASAEQTRSFLQDLLSKPEAGFILVAVEGAEVVGFAATYFTVSGLIAQRIAHLGDLFVVPSQRKRGVGTSLFDAVEREAAAHGVGLVRWLSLSSNHQTNSWYSRRVKPVGTFELYLRPTGV